MVMEHMDDIIKLSIEELVKQRPVLTEEEMNEFCTYEEAVDEAMNMLDKEMAKILKQTSTAEELYYDGVDLEQESDYKSAYLYFSIAAELGYAPAQQAIERLSLDTSRNKTV
jgi:TPR repeat protein